MSFDPMSVDLHQALPLLDEPTPEAKHRARLFVCSKAESVDDARMLMDMLGLLEESGPCP